MKLATLRYGERTLAGVVAGDAFHAFSDPDAGLPSDMVEFITGYDGFKPIVETALLDAEPTCLVADAVLLAPLQPLTIRDFVGFREHAENADKRFGMDTARSLRSGRSN